MIKIDSVVQISHLFLKDVIRPGQTVVDATVGNGYDTVFLAQLVGKKGMVYGFDVQKQAIDATYKILTCKKLLDRVKLICDGHQNIDKYIDTNINAIIFNLGYLPGSDHSIITKPDNTIKCIDKSKTMLTQGGLIAICLYTGHQGGLYERNKIIEYVNTFDFRRFTVFYANFINKPNNPPELIIIQKKKE